MIEPALQKIEESYTQRRKINSTMRKQERINLYTTDKQIKISKESNTRKTTKQ
jgi:hypothetical protein